MLLNTFQHLKGISAKKELELWRLGKVTWDNLDYTRYTQLLLFEDIIEEQEYSPLELSREALAKEDTDFFAKRLPKREYYRIALNFPEKSMFLDIETTGLSRYYDKITLIGWSLGSEYHVFINGDDDKLFREAISKAKTIITFNGSLFDIPFIKKEFKDINIPMCHIDLRFWVKNVGLSGGQKEIEKLLKIKRPRSLTNIKGENAPILWYKYCWGDTSSLKKLILYNHADIEGMKIIFDESLKRLFIKQQMPLSIDQVHHFSKKKSSIKWAKKKTHHNGNVIKIQPYKGKRGPFISIKELLLSCNKSGNRFVGIDLTGSEKRPSGWCLLKDDYAITERLGSDEEIIKKTIESQPKIISIDSPLSMPSGRTSVYDDDPDRDVYGIMRNCERMLKKRGINVYPSLIPSMQNLTARGIRIADYFRKQGIPVIESYPGAAQDIMGIPRKGLGIEFLTKGLKEFGVKGVFTKNQVSHDELDAITSAIVGLFFWSGKFEPLGNDDEDFLIIPDLNLDSFNWRERKVIGFSGPIAAGKTTAANFLKKMGYYYGRFSLVLEKLLKERDMEPCRQTLQQIGEEVNENPGQRWLCKKLLQMVPKQGNIVIDGLRHPEDYSFLVETFGPAFIHIYIDAPTDIRCKRYIADGFSKDNFLNAVSHQVESRVAKLSSLANIRIDNINSKDSLKAAIDNIILNK